MVLGQFWPFSAKIALNPYCLLPLDRTGSEFASKSCSAAEDEFYLAPGQKYTRPSAAGLQPVNEINKYKVSTKISLLQP